MNEIIEQYGIENILRNLGLRNIKEFDSYYQFSSPWRSEKNPSVTLFKNNLYCVDFGGEFKGHIFKLIYEITGQSAIKFLNIENMYSSMFNSNLKNRRIKKEEFKKVFDIKIEGEIFWKSKIYQFPEVVEYLNKRKLFVEFIDHFNFGFTKYANINGTKIYNRLLIPIYDISGNKIQSIECRDITGKSTKKVLYPRGGSVSTLFNYSKLNKKEPLIIVEGIMDMPFVWKHITKNVTTTFGIMITKSQEALIKQFDKVILFPDGDEGGRNFIKNLDKFFEKEFEIMYINNKDPGESSKEEILEAFNNRILSVNYFIENSNLFDKKFNW